MFSLQILNFLYMEIMAELMAAEKIYNYQKPPSDMKKCK